MNMRCWLGWHVWGFIKMDRLPFSRDVVSFIACKRCAKRWNSRA